MLKRVIKLLEQIRPGQPKQATDPVVESALRGVRELAKQDSPLNGNPLARPGADGTVFAMNNMELDRILERKQGSRFLVTDNAKVINLGAWGQC